MSLTLEDLKKLELPAKLIDTRDGEIMNITAFNENYILYTDNEGNDDYCYISRLCSSVLAPRTKIVEREYWVNVCRDSTSLCYISKETADRSASMNRLFCKHIKMKYEVDADSGAFIREIE